MPVKVEYTLPQINFENIQLKDCIEVFLAEHRPDDEYNEYFLEGKLFLPHEALEFAIKLAEAAITLMSKEALDDYKQRN